MKRGLLIVFKITHIILITFLCIEGLIFVGGGIFNICNPDKKGFSQLDFLHLAISFGLTLLLFGLVTLLIRKVLIPWKKIVVNKKFCIVSGIIAVLLLSFYFIDKKLFMKNRVLKHQEWKYRSGNEIRGCFINLQNLYFCGDTMIFNYEVIESDFQNTTLKVETNDNGEYTMEKIVNGISVEKMRKYQDTTYHEYTNKGLDTLVLKWQYFNMMKIMDVKTKKAGIYTMKN